MMRKKNRQAVSGLLGIVGLAGAFSAAAGSKVWDFKNDPTSEGIILYGNNDAQWVNTGGNPDGFLALTYSENSQYSAVEFPDIDNGKIVTSFDFKADLRVGNANGNSGRPADGFSISFARTSDPLVTGDLSGTGNFAGGIPEGGATTGIAVLFDTWSGNTLPDTGDIEGIMVRVDNKTVNKTPMTTRNGACDDATSLQTGPYNQAYWDGGGTAREPQAWAGLCWQQLHVVLTPDAKLTVTWKGKTLLDNLQTTFFPSPGKILLAGRTGGANENTHFDNISLTTTASEADTVPPTAPTNGRVPEAGARHLKIAWDAATDNSGRVAYRIERDGVAVGGLLTDTSYTDFDVVPGKSYKYDVLASDIAENKSGKLTINATTVAEIDGVGYPLAQIYRTDSSGAAFSGATQDSMDIVLGDGKYPNSPDSVAYVDGLSFGEPAFGDTYGENHMVRIATVLTAPETGSFRFFVRSDDASRLYVNKNGAAIPVAGTDSPVAQENGCCSPFAEPGMDNNGDDTFPTSAPIQLTAGNQYGILFLVKEGGGGDWGQVAMRKEGDPTRASFLTPIRGPILTGKGDPVGASITFTQQPADVTAAAGNQGATFTAAATVVSPYSKPPFYQWYHDGKIIPGATSATYKIASVTAADAGKYALEVGTIGLVKRSADATLTVTADTVAPSIASVDGYGTLVWVNFNEPVKATTGTFTLSGGVTVTSAAQQGANTIVLKTSGLGSETAYTLTATGVQDTAGNTIAANSTATFTSWKFNAGKVKYENYDGVGDGSVNSVLRNPAYPASPTGTELRDAFEAPVDRAENFGGRLSAWITPPTTGDYVFFVSSDDNSELYLSTDENPANVKRIAAEAGWSGARVWLNTGDGSDNGGGSAAFKRSDTYPGTQWGSSTINLKAGSKYYLELIYCEGGGGDNGAATWKAASAADPANGSPALTGAAVYGTYTKPAVTNPTLSVARDGANVKITYTGTLQGADAVTGPYTDVAGATSPYSTSSSAAQRYFRSRQ